MSPPFILSRHNIDPQVTPMVRRVAGGVNVTTVVDNSTGGGLFAFGQNLIQLNPPIPQLDHGKNRMAVDDIAGRRIVNETIFAGPTDPPFFVFRIENLTGSGFNGVGSNFMTLPFVPSSCRSLLQGTRWILGAGVAAVVIREFDFVLLNAAGQDQCPEVSVESTTRYSFHVTFTG